MRAGWSTLAAAGVLLVSASTVFGQARQTTASPSVSVGVVYDSNVFSTPVAQSDQIFRLSPGFVTSATRQHGKTDASYRFDAEQYRDQPELSTPLARQFGFFRHDAQATSTLLVTAIGDFTYTRTPAELNFTTGLTPGRRTVWRAHGGASVKRLLGSHASIGTGYDFVDDQIADGDRTLTHAGHVEGMRELSTRDEVHVRGVVESYHFSRDRTSVLSEVATVGWIHALTPSTKFTLEAGSRFTGWDVEPELAALIQRKTASSDVIAGYRRTQTTAVGLSVPLDVQRFVVVASYHRPRVIDLGADAGTFWNAYETGATRVYHASGSLVKPLGGVVSLAASFGADLQRPTSLIPIPMRFAGPIGPDGRAIGVVPPDMTVRRRVVMVQVVLSPSLQRREGSSQSVLPAVSNDTRWRW